MFYIMTISERAVDTVKFFAQSTPTVVTQGETLAATRPASPNYHGTQSMLSHNKLRAMSLQAWKDEATYNAWAAVQPDKLNAWNTARAAYNTANNITSQETTFSSDVTLF